MAIDYFDGFDDYSTAQLLRNWTAQSGSPAVGATGRNSTNGLRCAESVNIRKTLVAQQTRSIGFAVKFNTNFPPSGSSVFATLQDGPNNQVDLRIKSTGAIDVTRNSTVLATTTTILSVGVFYHIGLKAKIDPSTGTVDLWINEINVVSLTGQNTRASANSYADTVLLGMNTGSSLAGATFDFDDFWSDDVGTFHGDCRVETGLPNGDGAINNFARSAGSANYTQVNENPATDDTNYNSSATNGDIDLYTYPALTTLAGTIRAVMLVPVQRNDAAGTVTTQPVYRSGGTNYFGASNNIGSTTYGAYPDIQATDPNTGAAWTVAGVNNAQFGLKIVA
jgi:hypothetical protein